ncbi:MAG: helix-turn-helix domain-containing protein [Anaerolineae bacterium]|jgi:DNA-binding Lrp family transcriptional regulator|nr:helix-turn-helix domain-containing protein [Anaerolineae bacterium]
MENELTVVEVAKRLKLSKPTIRRLINNGELRGYKKNFSANSAFLVDLASVEAFERRRLASMTGDRPLTASE